MALCAAPYSSAQSSSSVGFRVSSPRSSKPALVCSLGSSITKDARDLVLDLKSTDVDVKNPNPQRLLSSSQLDTDSRPSYKEVISSCDLLWV